VLPINEDPLPIRPTDPVPVEEPVESQLSLFKLNVVVYFSGFVTRRLISMVSCEQCVKSLKARVDPSGEACKLIALRDQGGLFWPSQGVIRVCTVAEKVWDRLHSLVLQREAFKSTALQHLGSETDHLWTGHSQHPDGEHFQCLVKLILVIFFNTRRFFDIRHFNCRDFSSMRRYKLTKAIHFRSQ
jgi:hypothetical protein